MIHDIVKYDPETHAPYVRESWAMAARLDRRELDWWLRRPEVRALVATVPNSPGLILGWAAGVPDEGFLVWVQVKKLWWRRGLGKCLAAAVLGRIHSPRYAYASRIAERISLAHAGSFQYDRTIARRVPRESHWPAAREDEASNT